MGSVHGSYCKPILKQCVLEQTAKHFPQSVHGRFVNSKMCLLQSLVASISLPDSQASRDPWNSRWLDERILLPQNNNHRVKWKPWPALQIWAATQSVSEVGFLDGHGSKSSFLAGHDLDLLENQAHLCCLLFSVLPLLEVEVLVLSKEEGAGRTECRTEWEFSPGIISTDTGRGYFMQ